MISQFVIILVLQLCFIANALKDSDIYIGDKDQYGQPHGKGTIVNEDGIQYNGEFKNSLKEGRGKQTWPNGDEYIGEWKDNKMVGKGRLRTGNGHTYVGDFVGGKFEGQGEFYAKTGELVYNGTFLDSMYHGIGISYFRGTRTEGHFIKGFPDGPCKVTMLTEDDKGIDTNQGLLIYDGEFMIGQYHGKGVKYMFDYDDNIHYKIYDGEWDKGKRHGEGTSFDKTGKVVYKGEWDKGITADKADEL